MEKQLKELISQCLSNPDSLLEGQSFTGKNVSMSFKNVFESAEKLATLCSKSGLREGEMIGFRAPNCIEWVIWDLTSIIGNFKLHVFPEESFKEPAITLLSRFELRLFVDSMLGYTVSDSGIAGLSINHEELFLRGDSANNFPEHIHTRVYSSGTTGTPKGLNITKLGVAHLVAEFCQAFSIGPEDKTLIFLPISNNQQRLLIYSCLFTGANICITNFSYVFHKARVASPTFIIAPPVFYENIIRLFGEEDGNLQRGLGGKIRFLITGMAPIDTDLLRRFANAGIQIFEAYGITEGGIVAWNTPEKNRFGSVGKPLNTADIILTEEGEIVICKQHPLSDGYFSCDSIESDAFNENRIFTGDIGKIDKDGYLFLHGRKKDILLSKNGIKYHPSKIERELLTHPLISFAFTTQLDDLQMLAYLQLNEEIITSQELEVFTIKVIAEHAPGLSLFRVIAGSERPSLENGTLTRSLKLNRQRIRELLLKYLQNEKEVT